MSTDTKTRPSDAHNVGSQSGGVTPHLVCAGAADAIEFYKKAFGATEMIRMPGPNGKLMHAAVQINGAMVMLVDEMPQMQTLGPKALKGTPVVLHMMVPDVDKSYDQAVRAGAKSIMAPADMFWGDRYSQVEDPFGHRWSIATHQRDLTREEMLEGSRKMQAECGKN